MGFLAAASVAAIAYMFRLALRENELPPREPVPPITTIATYIANWDGEEWWLEFRAYGEYHAVNGHGGRWKGCWRRRHDILLVDEWSLETDEHTAWTVILDYSRDRLRFEGNLIDVDLGRRHEFWMADMSCHALQWLDERERARKK